MLLSHSCPLCKPELVHPITMKGIDFFDNQDLSLMILKRLSIKTLLSASTTSKTMHNWCHNTMIWSNLVKGDSIEIDPTLCVKKQVLSYLNIPFLDFFREPKNYELTISEFQKLKKKPYID